MATPKGTFLDHVLWRLEAVGFDLYAGLMRALPLETASDFGAWIARTFGPLTGPHRTAERNLRLAFPDMDDAERKRILKAQWDSLGRLFGEFAVSDRIVAASSGRLEVENPERLAAIAEGGGPAVFVSGHFSNFELMAAAIIRAGVKLHVTYRPMNNPYIDARVRRLRARYGVDDFAPKGAEGARALIDGLKRGESVALLNDQKFNDGVAVTFFSHTVMAAPGPSQLALRFGAPIQPLSIERTGKARFRAVAHEPFRLENTGDRAADVQAGVQRITDFIEAHVRERPEEWFWVHKRWPKEAYRALEAKG